MEQAVFSTELARQTRRGNRYEINHDAACLHQDAGLAAVFDGMGDSHVSSRIARYCARLLQRAEILEMFDAYSDERIEAGIQAIVEQMRFRVDQKFRRESTVEKLSSHKSTGATMVVMKAWNSGKIRSPMVTVAHLGDSRAYLHRDGLVQPLTLDHNLGTQKFLEILEMLESINLREKNPETRWSAAAEFQDALDEPNDIALEQIARRAGLRDLSHFNRVAGQGRVRNLITRLLDTDGRYMEQAEIRHVVAQPGDTFLAMTDGISSAVTRDEMAEVLERNPEAPLVNQIQKLIRRATANVKHMPHLYDDDKTVAAIRFTL